MSNNNRNYYKVTAGSPAAKAYEQHAAKYKEVAATWNEFIKTYGEKNAYVNSRLVGLIFDQKPVPEGWVSKKKYPKGVFYPARRKVCMEAYKVHNSLESLPGALSLQKRLGVDPVFTDSHMHVVTVENVGDHILFSLHKDSTRVPDGFVQIKQSEYWEIKENSGVAA